MGKGMLISTGSVPGGVDQGERVEIQFETGQTLAPNYNETIQIDDFLFAI